MAIKLINSNTTNVKVKHHNGSYTLQDFILIQIQPMLRLNIIILGS